MKNNLTAMIKKSVLFTLAFVLIGTNASAIVDHNYFSGNDILYYDPTACEVVATNGTGEAFTAVAGNDVAEKVYRFLTSTSFSGLGNKPFSALQAAGALGNFQQESSMNPAAIESNGEGHGLAQWSYSRKTTLFALAEKEGKPWSNLEVQLKMIFNEINSPYGKMLLDKGFATVSTPQQASYIFQVVYEGAGIPNQANRDSAAVAYYKKFSSMAPTVNTSTTPSPTGDSCGGVALSSSDNTFASYVTKDGFGIYNQLDPRWAKLPYTSSTTIGKSGCGPSAMTAIISALTGKATNLVDVVNFAAEAGLYVPGVGSSWQVGPVLATEYGLNYEPLIKSVTVINNALRAGSLIIVSGSGSAPFTSAGHFIVIRGVTADGKWLIADSNGQAGITNSEKAWDPESIMVNASDNFYAISK